MSGADNEPHGETAPSIRRHRAPANARLRSDGAGRSVRALGAGHAAAGRHPQGAARRHGTRRCAACDSAGRIHAAAGERWVLRDVTGSPEPRGADQPGTPPHRPVRHVGPPASCLTAFWEKSATAWSRTSGEPIVPEEGGSPDPRPAGPAITDGGKLAGGG